ncbi:hypothetical protein EPR50_G00061250 [Perca flavescens]|uniref:Uncharacterized protein n=1 Tax=Perca flavescens TaxID=8167 RepID=A0A484D7U6_PERFV|nr:hypothetical protein EPR50_G00061250 [Perca flavescens]
MPIVFSRAQKNQHNLQKSQCTGDTSTVNMSQPLTSGEGNEVPNTTEEDIYVNTNALRQADVPTPATISEPNSTNLPSSGPNNAQGDGKSLKTQNEEGNDVIYSSVNWEKRSKKKKKGEDYGDTHQPGSYTYLSGGEVHGGRRVQRFCGQRTIYGKTV